ncbi:MAG: hypothetical protein HC897_17615 [Thermoanaerobaculia bacterium]|nr:hypothetical protein [Thermoanaerobaculia bacterium]
MHHRSLRQNVSSLLASEEDTKNWQLRVRKDGVVYLSSIVGSVNIDDLAFRLETWIAGNSYVGTAAAKDQSWVNRIFEVLKHNWPNPSSTFIDHF